MEFDICELVFWPRIAQESALKLVDGFSIATTLGAQVRDIRAVMADAVDQDLLIRYRIRN